MSEPCVMTHPLTNQPCCLVPMEEFAALRAENARLAGEVDELQKTGQFVAHTHQLEEALKEETEFLSNLCCHLKRHIVGGIAPTLEEQQNALERTRVQLAAINKVLGGEW